MPDTVDRPLSAILWNLCRASLDELNEHRTQGGLQLSPILFLRTIVTNFTYEQGVTQWGTRLEPVTREQWDLRNQVAFIESRVKVREEYRRAVEAVADRQGISSEQSDVLVLRFVQLLVNRLRKDSDDAVLAESVISFVGDLDGA